jgi:hypothetical protein
MRSGEAKQLALKTAIIMALLFFEKRISILIGIYLPCI